MRERQVIENKDFARECQDHGCDGLGIRNASKEVNDKTYTYTPKGKPETWTEEEQQRQAIAKNRATKSLKDLDPYGPLDVQKVAGESAKESKHLVNEKGVDTIWDWLFGASSRQDEEDQDLSSSSETAAEPEFLTRAETIRREQSSLKESGEPPLDELEEPPFKFFIFF